MPFRFAVSDTGLSFNSSFGDITGQPLTHFAPPAVGALFEIADTGALLLTVSGDGEAVFTQQDITPSGRVQSVSYFGTCEPAA